MSLVEGLITACGFVTLLILLRFVHMLLVEGLITACGFVTGMQFTVETGV